MWLNSDAQSWKVLSSSGVKSASHDCPCFPHMPLSNNLIITVKGEHNPEGSNTEDTCDRTILWVTLAGTSFPVPRQISRLSVFTFHWSPKIEGAKFQLRRLCSAPLICLQEIILPSPSRSCKSISLVENHDLLRTFACSCTRQQLLPLKLLTSQKCPCRSFWWPTWRPPHSHPCSLVRLVAKHSWHMLFSSKNGLPYSYTEGSSLLFISHKILTTLQSASGTFTWRNIASTSAVEAICFSLNLKIIPICCCRRSGTAIKLSFSETPPNFEAALHTRLTLSGLFGLDREMRNVPLKIWFCVFRLCFIQNYHESLFHVHNNSLLIALSQVLIFFQSALERLRLIHCWTVFVFSNAALQFSTVARPRTPLRRITWLHSVIRGPCHHPWTFGYAAVGSIQFHAPPLKFSIDPLMGPFLQQLSL